MAKNDENSTKRKFKRLLQFFNIKTKANETPVLEKNTINTTIQISHFSEHELSKLPGVQSKKTGRPVNPEQYIRELVEENKVVIQDNKILGKLNPEVKQARQIFVSSVLSPNDMQTGSISVSAFIEGLSEDIQKKLNEFLNEFFNDEIEFGVRLEKWLGEALFETGSKPILILPFFNIENLIERDDQLQNKFQNVYASFESESVIDINFEVLNEIKLDKLDIVNSLEDENIELNERQIDYISTESIKLLKENTSKIKISYDATKLYKQRFKVKKKVKEIADKLDRYFVQFDSGPSSMMILTDENSGKEKEHAAIIELPSSAVVPVTVPGSKTEHIGYFVLVDEYGTPLSNAQIKKWSSSDHQRLIFESTNAAFGDFNRKSLFRDLNEKQRFKAASTVFGLTVKNLLEKTLTDLGLDGVDIDRYQTISACLFYHLIHKQNINLIFVPESLIVYYAFDFREDGTGKSLLEDLTYILAIRTTLIIAKTMAIMRSARDMTNISVELDESDTNPEQTLDIIKNMFVKKHMPRFYNDPNLISQDIIANSLSITPKNIPGLQNSLEVNIEKRTMDSARTDDDLLEKLNNMISLGFGVPPSALNLLNETEYSRSVATNNLFFSNNIRVIQRILNKLNKKFCKLYLQYSTYLKEKIKQIFEEGNVKDVDEWVKQTIDNIEVILPTPNISASKAQYEELQNYISLVDTLLEKMLPDELYGIDDRDAKELMATLRAQVKASFINDFIQILGLQDVISAPTIEDIDVDKIQNVGLFITNLKKGLDNIKKILSGEEESSGY